MARPIAPTIHVPILEFEARLKKESIGVPVRMEVARALGGGVARIKPRR
jgi:hypothetical protein